MEQKDNKKFDGKRFKTGYIDESGDPGKKGSKCLILTYICLEEEKKISKILRKARDVLRRTKKGERWLNRLGGEIKFFGFPDHHVLRKTIEEISKLNFPIRYVVLYKNGDDINPSEKTQIIIEFLQEHFNLNEMPHKIVADQNYFNDKKIAYFVIKDYEEHIEGENVKGHKFSFSLIDEEKRKEGNYNMVISIKHENSKDNSGLQVADLISGAIFQEKEHEDSSYINIIRTHNKKITGRIIKQIKK